MDNVLLAVAVDGEGHAGKYVGFGHVGHRVGNPSLINKCVLDAVSDSAGYRYQIS